VQLWWGNPSHHLALCDKVVQGPSPHSFVQQQQLMCSPNVRCMGTRGSQGLVMLGWLGTPGGGNCTNWPSSTSIRATGDWLGLWQRGRSTRLGYCRKWCNPWRAWDTTWWGWCPVNLVKWVTWMSNLEGKKVMESIATNIYLYMFT